MAPKKRKGGTKKGDEDDGLSLSNSEMIKKIEKMRLQSAELEMIKRFVDMDEDETRELDIKEFTALIRSTPVFDTMSEAQIQHAFRKIDADGSGQISLNEFKIFYENVLRTTKLTQKPYPMRGLAELSGVQYWRQYFYYVLFGGSSIKESEAIRREIPEYWIVGGFLAFVVLLSTIAFALETLPSLKEETGTWLGIEVFVTIVFVAEYIVRLCVVKYPCTYFCTFDSALDILSALPLLLAFILTSFLDGKYLELLTAARTLRLLRILKISRWETLENYFGIFYETMSLAVNSFMMLAIIFLMTVYIGAALAFAVESYSPDTNQFEDIFAAMYWCVVTQTTLGYGDIYPVTSLGRLVSCVMVCVGILNITFAINIIGSCFDEAYTRYLDKEQKKIKCQIMFLEGKKVESTERQMSLKTSQHLYFQPTEAVPENININFKSPVESPSESKTATRSSTLGQKRGPMDETLVQIALQKKAGALLPVAAELTHLIGQIPNSGDRLRDCVARYELLVMELSSIYKVEQTAAVPVPTTDEKEQSKDDSKKSARIVPSE